MLPVLAVVLAMAAPVPASKPQPLTTEEKATVRNAIYGQNPSTESPNRDFRSQLVIPKAVSELYKQKPDGVLELLVTIADGASPSDSLLAVSTAIELIDGPGGGVACVLIYKYDTWDKVDDDWKCTPREHWLKGVRKDMEKRKTK